MMLMKITHLSILALVIALIVAAGADAAILAKYTFNGGSLNSAGDDGVADPQPFTAPGDASVSSSTNTGFLRTDFTGSDQTAALADTDYFAFTINALPNDRLNLSSIIFDFGMSNNTASTYHTDVYLQSSVDGLGAGNPVIFTGGKDTGPTAGAVSLTSSGSIDLTDVKFQNLTTITFEIRFSDNVDTTSNFDRLDNIIVNGAAVPAPTPAALPAGLGLLAMAAMRRRDRSHF